MPTENPLFAEKEKPNPLDLTELLFFNVLHERGLICNSCLVCPSTEHSASGDLPHL